MPVRPFSAARAGILSAGLLAAALASGAARSADMPDIGFASPVQEFGSGWYLRGDVGYTWQSAGAGGTAVLLDLYSNVIDDYYSAGIGQASFDDTWVIGGGFGVQMSEWLRFDATIDYRATASGSASGLFSVYDSSAGTWSDPSYVGPDGRELRAVDSDVSSTLLLANVYLDLGTWGGFTPYVGAGIGAGYVDLGGINIADVGTASFDSQWGFAWALMAGASYEIGPGFLLDIGYRYSSIAGTTFTSPVQGADGLGEMGSVSVNVGDIDTQEVRVGVRYMID